MHLYCISIFGDQVYRKLQLTPSIYQQGIPCLGLDGLGVFDSLPWQLGKRFPVHERASLLMSKTVLLTVGCIPNPIDEKVRGVE